MKSSQRLQCYCCEETAATKDHIPPKCFFPERKHLYRDSPDYRKQLVTVASCPKHNNFRSKDDEYTAAVLAINSNSKLAFLLFKAKWVQVLLRREGILGKRIFSTARSAEVISVESGLFIPRKTLAISYELELIKGVIESIARALYYYETGFQEKWLKNCIIKSPNFLKRNLETSEDFHFISRVIQAFVYGEQHQELGLTKKGSHHDVFYYQIFKAANGNFIIRLVFYSDFMFLAFLNEDVVPNRIIVPAVSP